MKRKRIVTVLLVSALLCAAFATVFSVRGMGLFTAGNTPKPTPEPPEAIRALISENAVCCCCTNCGTWFSVKEGVCPHCGTDPRNPWTPSPSPTATPADLLERLRGR